MIAWSEKFRIGVDVVDNQHKHLFSLINKLSRKNNDSEDEYSILKVLEELVMYVKFHFSAEEDIMRRYVYPGYMQHKNQHENFKRKVLDFLIKYKKGNLSLLEIQSYIEDWIINHILYEDMKIGKYLSGKEIETLKYRKF